MSPSASDVSIITINWNGRHHLEHLMPSLAGQGAGEILVVDNGSADGSVEFLDREFPQVKILKNRVNEGFAQPCNLGARRARGTILAFINNDMRADGAWLQAGLGRLQTGTPCVASRILNWEGDRIDFNGSSLHYLGYALQKDIGRLVEEVSDGDRILFPCGGAMLIERETFLELEGFDPDFFAIYEDVDLGWRLWLQGYEVALAPESRVYHRGHATFDRQPNEKMRFLMHRNALLTILKNYEEEIFRRVLPLALVLGIKRAVLFSGVNKESFYLWSEARNRWDRGDSAVREQLMDSLNHLAALDDVLDSLPRTLEKRRKVQQRRVRSDQEIFELFEDPFRHIVEDPDYLLREASWLEQLDLSRLLGGSVEFQANQSPLSGLREKLASLEREISSRQWLAGHLLSHPPEPRRPGVRRFLQVWKEQGLGAAWRQFVEYVDRGL